MLGARGNSDKREDDEGDGGHEGTGPPWPGRIVG